MIEFDLTYTGGAADDGLIEFYDASRALAGFQRSLALTTHLVLHGEIITQAPHASGFTIYVPAFEEGSWKTRAKVAIATAFLVGSVGKDSPVGHAVTSLYSAALSTTMGFDLDYDKTLQELYHESRKGQITESKFDSLCEKIEQNVADMHRPIVMSKTAHFGQVNRCGYDLNPVGPLMSPITYEYVKQTDRDNQTELISGYITSYNVNTFSGRIFAIDQGRPVPFEIELPYRKKALVGIITRSQHLHGQDPFTDDAMVTLACERLVSHTGKVKRYIVIAAEAR
ncbi:hypothetical protein M2338_001678 [Sphingobium sp. B2D3B]|uniref:DUF7946 domain-containing protein n=1 Tax=Sphingobium sp. B2D3B TaxID=2940580 RepID=UPI0022256EDF|nr:hypothetical protein [Sphingobium sp. B2D3B]MCW2382113.1 hypothetical protein [Sphingobium sp. B2D3B]